MMLRIFTLLAIIFFVNACHNPQEIGEYNADLITKYLSEHSPPTISVKDPIIIRFIQESMDREKWEDNYFKITPSIKGELSWLDESTLQYKPSDVFTYNTALKIEISSEAFNESAQKENLILYISTKSLEFSIRLDDEPKFSIEQASISGSIRSSDWAEESNIEKLLRVSSGEITWVHSQNGKSHHFSVEAIDREDRFKEWSLTWNDAKHDNSFSGKKVYAIAPLGQFEVSHIEAAPETNKIEVRFTDELDNRQKLDGFFKIDGQAKNLRYTREGSVLSIFLEKEQAHDFSFSLNKNIKSKKGKTLEKTYNISITLAPTKPEVRLVGNGVITPYSNEILFPFEAKGLHAVDVEILKVFPNNILQFLQNYKLNANAYYLENVGRIIHQEKVNLTDQKVNISYSAWNRYAIDLQKMIDADPGALYVVRIGYRKDYTDYPCEIGIDDGPLDIKNPYMSIMRWNSNYEGYRYDHESDPCFPVYYNSNRFIQRNILASNLGIIVKGSEENKFSVHVRNLKSLKAEAEVAVGIYDFQQQQLLEDKTDSQGKLSVELNRKPGFIIASKGNEYAYVSLNDQSSNSLSDFEIGGSEKEDGLDGIIYGERGVWRPGDTMHLTFVLEDPLHTLPSGYPIEMLIKDARGQLKIKVQKKVSEGNIYVVHVPTEENDPTGNWQMQANVGDRNFYKALKVETVKPNRLKVNLELPERVDISANNTLPFSSSWLYGAPASDLKARVEASYSPISTEFSGFSGFEFDDPARKITTVTNLLFDKKLSNQGKGSLIFQNNANFKPPGRLKIGLRTRVFEPTGEYSEDYVTGLADPYSTYVGVKVPESSWGRKYFSKDADDQINFVVVDKDGNPVANRKLSIGLYEAEWSWWYNRTSSNIYRYNQSNHLEAVEKASISTGNDGQVSWSPEELSGYKYMVRVCDEVSGHCSGELFYTPYYDYESNNGAASILKLKSDKTNYEIGEEIEIKVPSNLSSKILVSVENGETILADYWVDGQKEFTSIKIPTTNLMAPNVYLHVTLVQEYSNESSELPLRMYGVLPIKVEDPSTRLIPEIQTVQKIQPKEKYQVTVSEKSGTEMFYTLAIVDEGLLGLTRYKTPELWDRFYTKQALGIKTWDIYDQVLQGFGGEIDKYISIGGDTDLLARESGREANRFNPVVEFVGPFKLEKGETNTHSFTMDNYMGAVRVMVVGRNKQKYGSVDKTVTVTNPLMILPTAPRTLAPMEDFVLPVNVIATEANINQANINLTVGPGLKIMGNSDQIVNLKNKRDALVTFNVSVQDYQGPTYVKITAKGGGKNIDQTIEFNIKNPNPLIYKVIEASLAKGESVNLPYDKIGTVGTNGAVLEISTFPAINLEKRLDYLIRYPYGCIEQTTSSVFPQLYLDKIVAINTEERKKINKNLQAGIARMGKFQLPSGGLAYWKGSREVSDWGTSYAGHFLLEAKARGHYVSTDLLGKWINYQKNKSKSWSNPDNYQYQNLMQAYRLYVLAKAGESEWGSMNVLKSIELDNTSTYVLAAAYTLAGQEQIGEEIMRGVAYTVEDYQSMGNTYGSGLRDRALITEALLSSGKGQKENLNAKVMEIARDLGNDSWYSTQTTAFALLAVGKYMDQNPTGSLNAVVVSANGKEEKVDSKSSLYKTNLSFLSDRDNVTITNNSKGTLYVRITLSGKADYGTTTTEQKNLKIAAKYFDLSGKAIDPSQLKQGTDFIAEVSIINPGKRGYNLEEMALSQVFPSGWEIRNERLTGISSQNTSDNYEYQDIRDNMVNTFFDMQKVKTYRTVLTAAYAGKYFLPDIQCEAMYDHNILARIPGQWITVTSEETIQ